MLDSARSLSNHDLLDGLAVFAGKERHKTREDIETLVRELDPLPDLRSSVRKAAVRVVAGSLPLVPAPAALALQGATVPTPSAPAAPVAVAPPDPRPVVQPSAPQRYHVRFTIGEETHRKLRRVQTLLRREIPNGDPGAIFDRALDVLLTRVEKTKLGAAAKPRRPSSIRPGTDNPVARASRHIPSEVKRAVSKRDADQCAFLSPEGRRCTQRAFLEWHHVQPFGHQGPATVANISLRCRAHNVYESERVFGRFDPSVVRETAEAYAVSLGVEPFRNGEQEHRSWKGGPLWAPR